MNLRPFKKSGVIAMALLLSSLFAEAGKNPLEQNVWFVIRPVNCLGNRWEKDWLARHRNRGDKYPRHQEAKLIKDYFMKQGVELLDFRVMQYMKGTPLCQTCGCERGDTLYLLVNGEDTPKMVRLGYLDRLPADSGPR